MSWLAIILSLLAGCFFIAIFVAAASLEEAGLLTPPEAEADLDRYRLNSPWKVR